MFNSRAELKKVPKKTRVSQECPINSWGSRLSEFPICSFFGVTGEPGRGDPELCGLSEMAEARVRNRNVTIFSQLLSLQKLGQLLSPF